MSMRIKKFLLIILAVVIVACIGYAVKIKNVDSIAKKQTENNKKVNSEKNPKEESAVQIDPEKAMEQEINAFLQKMTIEEKTAQLFIVLPEALMDDVSCVTAAGNMTKKAMDEIPVGGFVYLRSNLQSKEQVQEMLRNVQAYSMERLGVPPFLCVDEEGGSVTRIGGTGKFDVPVIEDMASIGQTQDIEKAREAGAVIGQYLAELGFNVDFAPVADVLTNSDNTVVKSRSFGNHPELVANMSQAVITELEKNGVYGTYKHFPGHGTTAGDTHKGYAFTEKTLEELKACELIPFQDGIDKGVSFIMAGHISLPNVVGDDTPASLSKYVISDLLRNQMGYDGIVITDAMNMGAVANQYSSAEAAVKALQAGVDLILMPENFKSAYQGVLKAVENGTLSEERIDESLRRILYVKIQMKKAD